MSIILWKGTGAGGVAPTVVVKARPMIEMQNVLGTWTDITPRWRADTPIILTYGILGNDPTSRVADPGMLEWQMDNGARRGGTVGEGSVMGKSRFDPTWRLNVPIRFSVGQTVGPRQVKFQGTLGSALPSYDGQHGERRVFCTALDIWDDYARLAIPDQAAVQGRTSGQLVTTLINSLPVALQPPAPASIENGAESFEWAFDGGVGQQITVRERFNDIALSEPAYAYVRGGSTGTQFVYETLTTRLSKSVQLTLTDAEITGLVAPGSRDDLYGKIRIHVYPAVVNPQPDSVIYSLDAPNTLVAGNSVLSSIAGPYRGDVDEMVGATAQIPPVANTDYTMNSAPDGSGTDLTANFNVTAVFTGTDVKFPYIQNTSATPGYITLLQVRGQIVSRQDTLVEKTVPGSYGVRTLEFDMPYQGNTNKANSLATFFGGIYGTPFAQIQSIRFCATRTATQFEAARTLEPGDKIAVTETTTGLTAASFVINSCQWEIQGDGTAWVTWGLEQSTAAVYWTLDVSTLDVDTVLGF